MPPVYEWIHATSHENFNQIKDDGYLKGNYCVDDFFDGKLQNAGAPRGSWFNANNYRGGPIDLTPYPEPNNDETVVALAFPVSKLLDPKEKYQLFKVSRIPCRYLQVKYAIVKQTDPFFAWCSQNLHHVEGNCDEHVSLTWDQAAASYVWSATDADEKVMVSVFVVNHDDRHPSVAFKICRPYEIQKIPDPS